MYTAFLQVKHKQVAGDSVFDVLYGRTFAPEDYTRSMKYIILELMAYDNERQRDHEVESKGGEQNIKGTPLSQAMFFVQYPELLTATVSLLTKKENDKLCQILASQSKPILPK